MKLSKSMPAEGPCGVIPSDFIVRRGCAGPTGWGLEVVEDYGGKYFWGGGDRGWGWRGMSGSPASASVLIARASSFCDHGSVNVINKPNLVRLATRHPATASHVEAWYRAAKRAGWRGLHEVRREFPTVDQVGSVLIFNILGGSYRLIVRVSYPGQKIFFKALLTHKEYDRKEWMKWT